jgi:glycosyltransferase involved in cell wall biosynthesis
VSERVVVVCPDTNIRLWPTRAAETAIGGGKSAILQLAAAWARAGHAVTIAGARVVEGEAAGVRTAELAKARGKYDVCVYVTGSTGHFRHPAVSEIEGAVRLFWINGPLKVEPPPGRAPDWVIAPARFLARSAVDSWGYRSERVVVIPGGAVTRRQEIQDPASRDEFAAVYASHPFKGLREAIEVLARVRQRHPKVRLHVYGSPRLHGDHLEAECRDLPVRPDWVHFEGEVAQREIESVMPRYGLMLYLTRWVDSFNPVTTEALAGGVVVVATAHGSNAEQIRHGWNGLLVRSNDASEPDLDQAEHLVRVYLENPGAYAALRARAAASVSTWDEQAAQWREVWRAPRPGSPATS